MGRRTCVRLHYKLAVEHRHLVGTHVPSFGNLPEVVLGDPRVPVGLQRRGGRIAVLQLAEGPLVDNLVVAGRLKERGGDPRLARISIFVHFQRICTTHLENEPTTEVDTMDLVLRVPLPLLQSQRARKERQTEHGQGK